MKMKILHYSLGLPPYRTGGLTKYSYDLMNEEAKIGNHIILLYPGHFTVNPKIKIIGNGRKNNIYVYEIINPLPVPLLGGIGKSQLFNKKCEIKVYYEFLKKIKPDIIHIHTLMGLHKEFIEAAKELDIKMLYTTHDYFGICPKVNLLDYKYEICKNYDKGEKCSICNQNSYSLKLIYLMQSKFYRNIKESNLIKVLRKYKKENLNGNKSVDDFNKKISLTNAEDYVRLRNYYFSMFKEINYFHFNSSTSENIYKHYINDINGKVINITHSDIGDKRELKRFDPKKSLKILYLGPIDNYKGFYLLKRSLDRLLIEGNNNWHLDVYGDNKTIFNSEYIKVNGKYNYKQLSTIFKKTDVIIIPSIWKETFGFTGLEALSYGVPIITTDNVGFNDLIINNKTGFIIKPNEAELKEKLELIIDNRNILADINKNIINMDFNFTMDKHVNKMINLYNSVIEGSY